jgi:hypothetical protein
MPMILRSRVLVPASVALLIVTPDWPVTVEPAATTKLALRPISLTVSGVPPVTCWI